jgi:hypothetical protein
VYQTRNGQFEGAKQRAARAVGVVFGLERGAAIRALGVARQIPINLLLQQFLLDEFEELFRLSERQAEMLNAAAVLFQRHDIGHSLFTAIIVAQDELEFDTHGGAPPGGMGR